MRNHSNSLYEALAGQIREIQGIDASDDVIEIVLNSITEGAVRGIVGALSAGITVVEASEVVTVASTDHSASRLDELQAKHGTGPCFDAVRDSATVRIDDYSAEAQWPLFVGDVIAQTPIRSTVVFRLHSHDATVVALAIHADHPHAFDAEATEIGMAFAAHAALAFHTVTRQQQFSHGLASRDMIGQAKGILMERFDICADEAFDLISRLSQDTNTKVAVVAQRLVEIDHPARQSGAA